MKHTMQIVQIIMNLTVVIPPFNLFLLAAGVVGRSSSPTPSPSASGPSKEPISMIEIVRSGFGMIGAAYSLYWGVRVVVTGVDVFGRWRRARKGDPNAWKVDGEE